MTTKEMKDEIQIIAGWAMDDMNHAISSGDRIECFKAAERMDKVMAALERGISVAHYLEKE